MNPKTFYSPLYYVQYIAYRVSAIVIFIYTFLPIWDTLAHSQ